MYILEMRISDISYHNVRWVFRNVSHGFARANKKAC